MIDVIKISRITCGWVLIIITMLLTTCISLDTDSIFFRFGPNDNLEILGMPINTKTRYAMVISYSVFNTIIRNLNHNIIMPWILLTVQNKEINRSSINKSHAYEISICSTLYTWFDYLIYINLLLAQFDLFMVETLTDMIGTTILTNWYLQPEPVYTNIM